MLIRNTRNALADGVVCALQGYGGARILNALQKATVANPVNTALCFGGVALAEKLFSTGINQLLCNNRRFLVLAKAPVLAKAAVSYGLATLTTLKVMHLAGLIASVPSALTIVGSVGLFLLVKQVILFTTPTGRARPFDLRIL